MMRMTIGVVFAAALTVSSAAQDFMAQPGVPAAVFPKPDRPVADIVSPIWHTEKERDDADEPGQLVRLLGIKSGMTVADIGAGSGYYVVRLSPIVGSNGRIIAEDIVPEYLRNLRNRVRDLGLQNVAISRGEPHDPRLPAGSVDIAIFVHMYQPRSAHGQRHLSSGFCATNRCTPQATGSDGRMQDAIVDCMIAEAGTLGDYRLRRGTPRPATSAVEEQCESLGLDTADVRLGPSRRA
jgi:hypothetical protein